MGLSVVSACSRECSTVCDSHGCSWLWVGYGAGGRSGAPQQPPWLTPIQFDTSILTVEPQLQPVISRADWHLRSSSWAVWGSLGGVLEGGKKVLLEILTGGQSEHRENSGPQLIVSLYVLEGVSRYALGLCGDPSRLGIKVSSAAAQRSAGPGRSPQPCRPRPLPSNATTAAIN